MEAARREESKHFKNDKIFLIYSFCLIYPILQMAFSEHNSDDEDGNRTGLIIRDITDTLENATNGLLAVAHTSGRDRYL